MSPTPDWRPRGVRALLFALAVALGSTLAVATFAGGGAAASPDVAVENVTTSPDQPAPGSTFTVTTTLANRATSNGSVSVTDLYVRPQGSAEEYARVRNVGSISPGSSIQVPLSMSIDDAGTYRLRVYAVFDSASGGAVTKSYPLLVTVEKPDDVLLSVDAGESRVNETAPVNVTVANGAASQISSVELRLTAAGAVEQPERITATIAGGTDRTFEYDATFETVGRHRVRANLTYTTSGGVTRSVTETGTVRVQSDTSTGGGIGADIDLTGVETEGRGVVTLQGDVANVGGRNAESVLLRVRNTSRVSPAGPAGEFFVGQINASQFETFELRAQAEDVSAIPVRIEYIAGNDKRIERVNVSLGSGGVAPDGPRGEFGPGADGPRDPRNVVTPRNDGGGGLFGFVPGGLLTVVVLVVVVVGVGLLIRRR